jgi:hypothetical protein
MPEIEKLLLNMKARRRERRTADSFLFSNDAISKKITEIMGRVSLRFTNNRPVTGKSIVQFLYKMDFITARKDVDGRIDRKFFDNNRFLANEFVDFGYDWEIHPAYRWALNPQDIQHVIDTIDA